MTNTSDLPHPTLKKFCFCRLVACKLCLHKPPAGECSTPISTPISTLLLLISKWPQMAFYGFKLPFGVIWSTWSHFPLKQRLLLQRLLHDKLYGSYRGVIKEVARKLQGSCKEVARKLQGSYKDHHCTSIPTHTTIEILFWLVLRAM